MCMYRMLAVYSLYVQMCYQYTMCMYRCVSSICTVFLSSVHCHVDRGVEKKKELTSLTSEEVLETVQNLTKEDST